MAEENNNENTNQEEENTNEEGGGEESSTENEGGSEEETNTQETQRPPVAPPPVMAPVQTVTADVPPAPAPSRGAAPDLTGGMKQNEDGTVTVSAEALAAVLGRISSLEETQKLQLQVEDRNTIAKIERLRSEGKLVKSVKVRRVGEKYVVGWQTLQDDVYIDENGRVVEKQLVKIFFDDQTDKTYTMRQWAGAPEYVPFEVTGETKDADGNLFFNVVGPDGKQLHLNAAFIN